MSLPAKASGGYERLKGCIEFTFPVIFAVAIPVIYYKVFRSTASNERISEIVGAALNVASIAAGFLISAKAILLSIANSRIIRKLRKTGHFEQLVKYFVGATWWNVAVVLVSVVALWFDFGVQTPKRVFLLYVWLVCCGGCLGSTLRSVWLFGKLVRSVSAEPDDSGA